MFKIMTAATVAALTLGVAFAPQPAAARDGQIAAGIIGGVAVGAIVGSQMNRDDGYRGDRGYYRAGGYQRECYIERRDFEDRYGRLHVRNVRVCR
jgi:hypothetical protein